MDHNLGVDYDVVNKEITKLNNLVRQLIALPPNILAKMQDDIVEATSVIYQKYGINVNP